MSRCLGAVSSPSRRAQRFAGPIDPARLMARRQYRCTSCSQVKPMAPSIVSASSTRSGIGEIAITAAPAAARRCWSSGSSAARTASQAAAVANSLLTNSIAALCCSAWKVPITLPNCSRVRRCAVTASTHHCAMPAVVLATRPTTTHRRAVGVDPGQNADSAARYSSSRRIPTSATRSVPCDGFDCRRGLFGVHRHPDDSRHPSVRAPTRITRAAHTPAVTFERAR